MKTLYQVLHVTRGEVLAFFTHLYNRRIANKIYHEEIAHRDAHGRYWYIHNVYHTDPNNWNYEQNE